MDSSFTFCNMIHSREKKTHIYSQIKINSDFFIGARTEMDTMPVFIGHHNEEFVMRIKTRQKSFMVFQLTALVYLLF